MHTNGSRDWGREPSGHGNNFLQQHHAVRDYTMSGTSLANIKQYEGESLKSYIHRFNMEAAKVGSLTRGELKMAITIGVRPGNKL